MDWNRIKRLSKVGDQLLNVICGITIGRFAFVGAGTVVIRDVPAYALVVGNPAKQIGFMCECGERLEESLVCAWGRGFERDAQGLRMAMPS